VRVARLPEANGSLVGALVADPDDEVLVIMERGKVVRSAVSEVPVTGRDTQGVIFAKPDAGDRIIAIARNGERHLGEDAGSVGGDGNPVTDAPGDPGTPDPIPGPASIAAVADQEPPEDA